MWQEQIEISSATMAGGEGLMIAWYSLHGADTALFWELPAIFDAIAGDVICL